MKKSIKNFLISIFGFSYLKKIYHKFKGNKYSFSESDLILDYFYKYSRNGRMFDVGVHFGESFQNFIAQNWEIIGFEADPKNFSKIENLDKISIYQNAVSDIGGKELDFFGSDESSGISSLTSFHESHKAIAKVKTITLAEVVEERNISSLDFLKIDIEGHDLFALKGFPFNKITPEIILCEFEDFKTKQVGYDFKELGGFLHQKGFIVYLSEWKPIEKYGIEHQWLKIQEFPCELENSNGWGNFIAVRKEKDKEFKRVLKNYQSLINR